MIQHISLDGDVREFVKCLVMKLMDQVVLVGQRLRLARNTIDGYAGWIRGYLEFCAAQRRQWTHPKDLGTTDVEAFLNELVVRRCLSASSQNQALCALVFLYRHVLENVIPSDHLGKFELLRSRRPKRIPTVLSADEVGRLMAALPRDGNALL